jgi:hypothetical protein
MTKTEVFAELEQRMGPLNETVKQAVDITLELVGQGGDESPPPPPAFQGENPPFAEMARLPEEERIRVMDELADLNEDWLERKRVELGARWIIVVDGEVLAHGPTLANYPSQQELRELCQKTGKMLLLHAAPLLIEEAVSWHRTIYPADFYPTVGVAFRGSGQSVQVAADFDTGAPDVCVDSTLLEANGVITVNAEEPWRRDVHLGQRFHYTFKDVAVVLTAADGTQRQAVYRILCVRDWQQSPFVRINPNRAALVGRDLCLQLQPSVTLNFAQHETTLQW